MQTLLRDSPRVNEATPAGSVNSVAARTPAGTDQTNLRQQLFQMSGLISIALILALSASATLAQSSGAPVAPQIPAAKQGKSSATAETTSEVGEHGLSQKAVEVGHVFGFPITNSMVVSWVVAVVLILFVRVATRRMDQVPSGAQNFLEWLIESLYGFLEGLLGKHLVDRTFWYFATVFIFILSANWLSLLPGVGVVGWGHATPHGWKIDQPLLRGANADVNLTLAMALVFFACWIVWALREVGPKGFLKELFAPKGESTGILKFVLAIVFFVVGCLEVVSILFRPVSLSFRLYGNTFAGENMLETMANLVPGWGWLLPIPFYFLELLVGLVQALVFMLLTAVFTLLICQHDAPEAKAAH